MWWNYKKPRPFKPGAFKFAVTAEVPIIPFFITMEDTDKIGEDGLLKLLENKFDMTSYIDKILDELELNKSI